MKAVVYDRYGPPEVLHVEEVDKPEPGKKEIRIRVMAAEATKADCEFRSFVFPVKWFWLPLRMFAGIRRPRKRILGGYLAGVVDAVGSDVVNFSIGDQVFGSCQLRLGAHGEYVCLPESYPLSKKPDNLTFEEAAAVPLGGFNALHFMQRANIERGDEVLINGAGASIGTFAVQIARVMGAKVTAVDSGIKEEMLKQIGVDHFFDYTTTDYTTMGKKYDVIFDMVAGSSYAANLKSLKPGGRYLKGNPRLSDMARAVISSRFTDKSVVFAFAPETKAALQELTMLIESGQIAPVVDSTYSMSEAAEAHRRVESEQRRGIVVLTIGSSEGV